MGLDMEKGIWRKREGWDFGFIVLGLGVSGRGGGNSCVCCILLDREGGNPSLGDFISTECFFRTASLLMLFTAVFSLEWGFLRVRSIPRSRFGPFFEREREVEFGLCCERVEFGPKI